MNEPLSLEGDIRYLKEHIVTKDRQLAEKDNALYDAEFRIRIYHDAVIDEENESKRLREENKHYHSRITELEDTIMRLGEEKRISGLGHNLGLTQDNTHLRQKLDEMHQLAMTRLNDNMGLAQENEKLREQILDLEQSNRDLKNVMNNIRHWLDKSITHIDDWSENG